jgi:hypothetical protein
VGLDVGLGGVLEGEGSFESGVEEVEVLGQSWVMRCLLKAASKKYLQDRYRARKRMPRKWFSNL